MKNSKTIIYIIRAPLSEDPRMQKYVNACKATNTKYLILSWDRLLINGECDDNEIQFKRYMPYGNGRQNIWSLCLWALFVGFNLLKRVTRFHVIHVVNFDGYVIAYPFKIFGKKVIYDIYDSSTFRVEPRLARKSDLLILPHRRRLDKMRLKETDVKNLLIVENAPVFMEAFPEKTKKLDASHIHLSYVGSFEKNVRGLENVLEIVARDSRFILDVAGSGVGLDEVIQRYSQQCPRIRFHGKVPYPDALRIMYDSDFIVALYYLCASAHRWACPNKICESLFLSVPVITSKGTLVGSDVQSMNSGYVVEDSKESFLAVFENYGSKEFIEDYNHKVQNCRNIWENKYKNYFMDVLVHQYIEIVNKL